MGSPSALICAAAWLIWAARRDRRASPREYLERAQRAGHGRNLVETPCRGLRGKRWYAEAGGAIAPKRNASHGLLPE